MSLKSIYLTDGKKIAPTSLGTIVARWLGLDVYFINNDGPDLYIGITSRVTLMSSLDPVKRGKGFFFFFKGLKMS